MWFCVCMYIRVYKLMCINVDIGSNLCLCINICVDIYGSLECFCVSRYKFINVFLFVYVKI